ncbi:MAG: hypothetical protein PWR13_160 [Archaeoglobi archaeon]|nr:C_GCAxxG_C_C family protein [Candidatus Mnemosynella bozhongmuii]MDI3502820.1 hypothetical protein [Archaeoglobi archaeon]MDK2781132.1 hypothetical protein [Archaeoglobi archaeon]
MCCENCKKIIEEAIELGRDYEMKYVGCAQSSFSAIIDALRKAGIELIEEDVEEIFFKALVGVSGGVGATGRGSCGAVTGASLAVSLATGIGRKEQERDPSLRARSYENVRKYVVSRFLERFGGITCREVQLSRFGKAWDMSRPDVIQDFRRNELENCRTPDGRTIRDCTIALASAWAVEGILEILKEKDVRKS